MIDPIHVWMTPHYATKSIANLTVNVHIDDYVHIKNLRTNEQKTWGYCIKDSAVWQPLSGFPLVYLSEVQRQISALRGFKEGEGPPPPAMLESGPTNKDQEAEQADEDESEFYE